MERIIFILAVPTQTTRSAFCFLHLAQRLHFFLGMCSVVICRNSKCEDRYPYYRPWRRTRMWIQGIHILAATAAERGRVARSTLGRPYSKKSLGTHSIGVWTRWSKEISPPFGSPGSNAVQSVAKSLAAWATWLVILTVCRNSSQP